MTKQTEVWLRGPIEGFAPLLQPVVHAIKQAQEEIHHLMLDFPSELLWEKPFGMASSGFHLRHIVGVLDRMVVYASGGVLTASQFSYLASEGEANADVTTTTLLENLDRQIDEFLDFLSKTDSDTLTEFRTVGRAQLPSTVGGLLFHAAEHTQRHLGQLLVTVRVVFGK